MEPDEAYREIKAGVTDERLKEILQDVWSDGYREGGLNESLFNSGD